MDFKTKIDKVLKVKKLALWKLAEQSSLASTLQKAYRENREMKESSTDRFLGSTGINPEWWATGQGEMFVTHNGGSYDLPAKVIDLGSDQVVMHRRAFELLEEELKAARAIIEFKDTRIKELHSLHQQHNEMMKGMLELIKTLSEKKGKT